MKIKDDPLFDRASLSAVVFVCIGGEKSVISKFIGTKGDMV